MDEDVSQDVERIRSNDRCAEIGEEHDEDYSRSKYNNHGDGEYNSESQHQQLGYQHNQYHRGIRRSKIPNSKRYGKLSISSSTNANR